MVLFFLLSPHPADPTLTTENLMDVVRRVESRWEDLSDELGVRYSEDQNIQRLYQSDHQKMEALVNHYVQHCPFHSWSDVASALEEMKLRHLAKVVTTKYVRGIHVVGSTTSKWWVSSNVYLLEFLLCFNSQSLLGFHYGCQMNT